MALASAIITSARYNLRDEDLTQYSDAMLLDFLNQGLRPLCVVLASLRSDWVNASTTLSLLITSQSVALPSDFISDISAKISTKDLVKKSVSWVRDFRISSTTGEPNNYAIQGTNFLVERTTDAAYSIIFEYNQNTAALVATDNMPFNDEFNDILRHFIVLMSKSRNEYTLSSDAAIHEFFYAAVFSKLVARNYIPSQVKTDF